MTNAGSRRVIAIMAKAPIPGEAKTRLIPALGPERAARLQRAMLLDTIDLSREALADDGEISIITPSDLHRQVLMGIVPTDVSIIAHGGPDLMTGLEYGLAEHLHRGSEQVILLDGDSPTLPPTYLADAFRRLAEHDVVLGPTRDGGYYLIGATSPQPRLFRWETNPPDICEQTRRRAESEGATVALLPEWFDVDTREDLERLVADLQTSGRGATRVRSLLALEQTA